MVHEVVSRHRHQKRPRSHLPLVLGPLGAGRRTCCPREERRYCPQGEQRHCPQGEHRSLCTRPCHYRRHRHILHTLVGVDGETYGRLRVVLCVWWCCGGVVVGRGVLRFKKGVCSKRVSGSVVLEASSSRARFICTTVVQIGVAVKQSYLVPGRTERPPGLCKLANHATIAQKKILIERVRFFCGRTK